MPELQGFWTTTLKVMTNTSAFTNANHGLGYAVTGIVVVTAVWVGLGGVAEPLSGVAIMAVAGVAVMAVNDGTPAGVQTINAATTTFPRASRVLFSTS